MLTARTLLCKSHLTGDKKKISDEDFWRDMNEKKTAVNVSQIYLNLTYNHHRNLNTITVTSAGTTRPATAQISTILVLAGS